MALNFKELKKSHKSDFEKLQKQIEADTSKGGSDARFWSPATDKAGNGYAVIRFLPAPPNEDTAFVRMFNHAFKGPTGQWYIENSRTTITGEKDPVSELNSSLWNQTEDDDSPQRKQARAQKRKLNYFSNIQVLKDPANPENEGKVFLFKYGKKIWDKIQGAMYPEFQDEKGFNPFDLWEGANFKLKIRQVEGYRNYDKSEFEKPEALTSDDDKAESIWKSEHSLQELVALDKFKSYDDLAKRLAVVLGNKPTAGARTAEGATAEYTPRARTAEAPVVPANDNDEELPWSETNSASGEVDELSLFEELAKG